jgi:CRISPR-associated protein Cmr6
MPISASPAYLGRDFSAASPGLRFGLLLPVWTSREDQEQEVKRRAEAKSREGDEARELLRRGMDHAIAQLSQRPRHPLPRPWAKNKDNARQAWKGICKLGDADRERMQALAARQAACAAPLLEAGCLLALEAIATAPFTTGLGNEHPLENGFAFLNPYGLPYLPGSGVKGVLRRAARELASGDWGDAQGWTEDAITHLFGLDTDQGGQSHQRGALSFWDVLPQLSGDLQVEVMTPHQSHYYQGNHQDKADDRSGGSTSPHDSGQPNPILFLTVPPRSRFLFHVQCDLPFLQRLAPPLAEDGRWQALLQAALAHAFAWLGFGAKTAVGYGAMAEDPAAAQRRAEAQAERERQAAAAAEAERKARLSPEDRAWEEAQPVIAAFRAEFERARQAPFNPGGPFNQARLSFVATALGWTEPRSRAAAAQVLEASATKAWGRPSKKERWEELQAAIAQLKGQA